MAKSKKASKPETRPTPEQTKVVVNVKQNDDPGVNNLVSDKLPSLND